MTTAEKRLSRRAITHFATLFSSGRLEGLGVLCDFSSTGARVEEATAKPAIGARVVLHVPVGDGDRSFDTRGSVVRHTEGGFAIEFEKAPIDLRQLLEETGAVALVIDDFPGSAPSADPIALDERPNELLPVSERAIEQCTVAELEALASQVSSELERKRELSRQRKQANARVRAEVMRLADREGLGLEEVISVLSEEIDGSPADPDSEASEPESA